MKPGYIQHIACVFAFLALGLYDVHDNFRAICGGTALMVVLLAAIAGSTQKTRRMRVFGSWKLFFTALFGFVLSCAIGSLANQGVDRAASTLVASIYDYKKHTGVYPESLMQVATANNIDAISRKKIKYGSRLFYARTEEGFHLSYQTYPFNDQAWDLEKKVFVEMMD